MIDDKDKVHIIVNGRKRVVTSNELTFDEVSCSPTIQCLRAPTLC